MGNVQLAVATINATLHLL